MADQVSDMPGDDDNASKVGDVMENGQCVYQDGMITVSILTDDQARPYREMPVGLSQDATTIRSVAERDGKKQILEFTADGISRTIVKV